MFCSIETICACISPYHGRRFLSRLSSLDGSCSTSRALASRLASHPPSWGWGPVSTCGLRSPHLSCSPAPARLSLSCKAFVYYGGPFPTAAYSSLRVWGGKTEQRSTVSSGIQLPARPAASSLGSKTGDTAAIAVLLRLQVYQLSQKQRHELLVDLERDDGHRDDRHDDERGAAAREGGRRHGHRAGRVPLLPRHRRGDDPEEREDAKGAWLGVGVGVGVGVRTRQLKLSTSWASPRRRLVRGRGRG